MSLPAASVRAARRNYGSVLSKDGNTSFETIRSILGAMGLRLTVEAVVTA